MNPWPKIVDIASDVRNGKASAMALVKNSLKRIEAAEEYKAIIATINNRAVERA